MWKFSKLIVELFDFKIQIVSLFVCLGARYLSFLRRECWMFQKGRQIGWFLVEKTIWNAPLRSFNQLAPRRFGVVGVGGKPAPRRYIWACDCQFLPFRFFLIYIHGRLRTTYFFVLPQVGGNMNDIAIRTTGVRCILYVSSKDRHYFSSRRPLSAPRPVDSVSRFFVKMCEILLKMRESMKTVLFF